MLRRGKLMQIKFLHFWKHFSAAERIMLFAGVFLSAAVLFLAAGLWMKTGGGTNASQTVSVKAVHVIRKDVPVNYEYVGEAVPKNEVKIISKVSGNVTKKLIEGSASVYEGQPLFQIDDKQYRSAVRAAKAALEKAQTTARSSERTAQRYGMLSSQNAVARETADSYASQAEEDRQDADEKKADLESAEQDLEDTLVLSPVNGKIDINDVSAGAYASAGSTVLATVSSVNPMWVKFSMSENDYLKFLSMGNNALPDFLKNHVSIVLSNGQTYPLEGTIDQIDRGIDDTTGTISIKAVFDNPNQILAKGMFAKVIVHGGTRKDAVLIPQKAVKGLLDKNFVMVIDAGGHAESKQVQLGEKVGNMVIVSQGLEGNELIVSEGVDKVKKDSVLSVTVEDPADTGTEK